MGMLLCVFIIGILRAERSMLREGQDWDYAGKV